MTMYCHVELTALLQSVKGHFCETSETMFPVKIVCGSDYKTGLVKTSLEATTS